MKPRLPSLGATAAPAVAAEGFLLEAARAAAGAGASSSSSCALAEAGAEGGASSGPAAVAFGGRGGASSLASAFSAGACRAGQRLGRVERESQVQGRPRCPPPAPVYGSGTHVVTAQQGLQLGVHVHAVALQVEEGRVRRSEAHEDLRQPQVRCYPVAVGASAAAAPAPRCPPADAPPAAGSTCRLRSTSGRGCSCRQTVSRELELHPHPPVQRGRPSAGRRSATWLARSAVRGCRLGGAEVGVGARGSG